MTIKSIRTGWTGISALAGNPVIGDFESIQTVTVASTSATLEFTSIPTTYQHLQIRLIGRVSNADTADNAWLRFNGDSGSNYSWHYLEGDGSGGAPVSSGAASQTRILAARVGAASAATGIFGIAVIDILDYKSTDKYKTTRSLTGIDRNGSGNLRLDSGSWRSFTAIESISISNGSATNFVQHTHAALYGIRG